MADAYSTREVVGYRLEEWAGILGQRTWAQPGVQDEHTAKSGPCCGLVRCMENLALVHE